MTRGHRKKEILERMRREEEWRQRKVEEEV
jgi:hypothetical protein